MDIYNPKNRILPVFAVQIIEDEHGKTGFGRNQKFIESTICGDRYPGVLWRSGSTRTEVR